MAVGMLQLDWPRRRVDRRRRPVNAEAFDGDDGDRAAHISVPHNQLRPQTTSEF